MADKKFVAFAVFCNVVCQDDEMMSPTFLPKAGSALTGAHVEQNIVEE